MSGDRIASSPDLAEDGTATDEDQHSSRCSQVSALCCCIPRRRMSLPGKRPKERKKKKNEGGLSFSDILFEEERDITWDISLGSQDSVQINVIKPTHPQCSCASGTKDHCIPLPIGTFYLEERQKGNDEKPDVKSFYRESKVIEQPKEGLHDLCVFGSEMENKTVVSPVSEGLPFEEGPCYHVTPDRENRQTGRHELLGALVQEEAQAKEQQEGGDRGKMISVDVPCTKAWKKQEQQAAPFQELQQSEKQELKSTLPDFGGAMPEEQSNCADHEDVIVLQDLLDQPQIPRNEEEQRLQQASLAREVVHKAEEQVAWDKVNVVPKEDICKKVQGDPDSLYQEERQPVELTCPPSLPIMEVNHEQEPPEMLHHVDVVSETSHKETEHNYQNIVDQEIQHLIIPKPMSCLFPDTAYEKEKEIQGIVNSTSDSPLSKAEEHQCFPHQLVQEDVAQENKTTCPPDVTCTMEQQKLAHMNNMHEEGLAYTTEQKNPEKQHTLSPEYVSSTDHHRISHKKEQQEGLDHSHSGSQDIACTGEQENLELLMSENIGLTPDNVSYEKEQQRTLDCGDSGSDSLQDKEDQDYQATLYLEGQPPLVLDQLSSVLLTGTAEVEQCARKSGTLETHSLEEKQVECGDQSQKLISVSSKEKEAKDDQEEQDTIPVPPTQWNAQEATFIPHGEQQQKEQFSLGMTCEEHQRKEKQGLSETTFSRKDEENM